MTRRPWVVPVTGLALLIPLASASANPEPKTESAQKAVLRVAKAFSKLESYAVTYEVQGGMGDPRTGRITAASVAETFQGRVVGQLSKIEAAAPTPYRPRAGVQPGAIREGSIWKGVMATETGRKLDRLFTRPEVVLAEVVKSKATAPPGSLRRRGRPRPPRPRPPPSSPPRRRTRATRRSTRRPRGRPAPAARTRTRRPRSTGPRWPRTAATTSR